MFQHRIIVLASILLLALPVSAASAVKAERVRLDDGFSIRVLTDDVPNARQMALGPQGTLFVGTRRAGKVYAVPNALTDAPGEPITIARGLTTPSGLTVRGDDLWVSAHTEMLRFPDIEPNLRRNAPSTLVTDALPTGHHGWRYIKFGPDGYLYVPVGAPCNICLEDDERYATILRMDPDDGSTTVFAQGVRNSVGFDWHPDTEHLWFSDNGRDHLGDDVPAEEINIAGTPGLHFGFPYVHAGDVLDPDFGAGANPDEYEPPAYKIQAHSAPLGVTFYTGDAFPERFRGALFIAEHGSWNRSSKVGYRVSVIIPGAEPAYQPFAEGWFGSY